MAQPILIASTGADRPTYSRVVAHLGDAGHAVIVIDSDAVATGTQPFEFALSSDGARIRYGDVTFRPENVGAAWYRHPDMFGYDGPDRATQMCLTNEADALLRGLWALVPEERWLNAPSRIHLAQIKLLQLMTAAELGFATPPTLVTNQWPSVLERFAAKPFIVKMPSGYLYEDHEHKNLYTTVLNPPSVDEAAATNPFPAIFQPFVEKRREWRITLVGDAIFSATIYTDEYAKDDWRRHQLGDAVQFKAEDLPEEEASRCRAYLDRYDLKFGAFDLIEDTDGRFWFLELNPNGQFLWLEHRLGMNISASVASILSGIAADSSSTI